jgi:serine/threonine-protein kinase
MIEFRAFGSTSLKGKEGNELLSVLTRPKLLSLLAALSLGEGGGFVRREWVVGLLWGDSDPERARAALRQALYRLRQALGPRCVESRGEDEVRIDPSVVWCDAREFQLALAEGRLEDALGQYRGDLLEGFFPPDVPEFERWLEQRRDGFRRAATEAALKLAEGSMAAGNQAAGGHWARVAADLAENDEGVLRRCMNLLAEAGDAGGALELFRGLEDRLADTFGTKPSAETCSLAARIRSGGAEESEVPDPKTDGNDGEEPASPDAVEVPQGAAAAQKGLKSESSIDGEGSRWRWRGSHSLLRRALAPAALLAVMVIFFLSSPWLQNWSAGLDPGVEDLGAGFGIGMPERAVLPRSHLAILPLRVLQDDSDLRDLSRRLYQDIVAQLSTYDGLTLVSGPTGGDADQLGDKPAKLGRLLGAGTILIGTLERSERGIKVNARLLATFPEEEIFSEVYEGSEENFLNHHEGVVQELTVALVGSLSEPEIEGLNLPFPRNAEAYRPYLRAQGMAGPRATPSDLMVEEDLLKESLSHDGDFPEAWAALARNLIRQEGTRSDTESLADSALVAAQTALALDPLSPKAHLAMGWVYLDRGFLDQSVESLRQAIKLNPDEAEAHYLLGRAHFALGHFDEAIQDFREAITLNPKAPYARVLMALTYASVDDLGTAARLVREELETLDSSPAEEAQLRSALQMWQQEPEAAFETGMDMVATAPDVPNLRTYLADLALQAGHCSVALDQARIAMAMSPDPERLRYLFYASTILGGAEKQCGDPVEARAYLNRSKAKLLRQVESGQENPSIYLELGAVSDALGDRKTAIVWLTRAYQLGFRRASILRWHPLFSGLRSEPAVQKILRDIEADLARMRKTVEANSLPPQ